MVEVRAMNPSVSLAEGGAPARLAGATRAEIARALADLGVSERERNMRVSQLWHWIYHRGVRDFSTMRNISRPLLDKFAKRHNLARPEIVAERISADGTRKWLLRMPPAHRRDKGDEVECVYIPETDRGTLCVSSQVGCTLNCSFCHTGTMPLVRNLTAAEIVGQVLVARDRLGDFPGGAAPRRGARAVGRGRPRGFKHSIHGHGRAALQFRRRARRDRGADRWRRPFAIQASDYSVDFGRRACDDAAWRRRRRPCSPFRCMRPTIRCATSSCR